MLVDMTHAIFALPDTPEPAVSTPADGGWLQAAQITEVSASEPVAVKTDRWREGYEQGRRHQADLDQIKADGQESIRQHREEHLARMAKLQADHLIEMAKIKAECRLRVDYIRGPVGEGYIYVVAFSTGVVKVGQTEDPKQRLYAHQSKAGAFGVGTVSYWISPPHWNFKENETQLIKLCSEVSARSRLEYFHEVSFDQAADFAWSLPFNTEGPEQSAVTCGVS